jgi:hypothetical protein
VIHKDVHFGMKFTPRVKTENCNAELTDFYAEIAKRNPDAWLWLMAWHEYAHGIDDVVDGTPKGVAPVIRGHWEARKLYSLPFYIRHQAVLDAVLDVVTHMYADSVEWETSDVERHRRMADVLRFAGNCVVVAVARLCGWGWNEQRMVSLLLWDMSWRSHHNAEGAPC